MARRNRRIRIIPTEIMSDILCLLPTKSLGRFKCVSKEWLSLISDSQFIKTHHKTLKQNCIIFLSKNEKRTHLLYSYPFHHHEALLKPTKPSSSLSYYLRYYFTYLSFGGSCDGLVLVYDSSQLSDYEFLVLNPTTSEFRKLPDSGDDKILDHVYKNHSTLESGELEIDIIVGFGYDSLIDDYKVVTFSHFNYGYEISNDRDYMSVQVYSLKTNTWSRKSNPPDYYDIYQKDAGIFVNGFIHWIAKKSGKPVILAFSLANEKFSKLPSPKFSKEGSRLFVLVEKLAIFSKGEVWVMNGYGNKESWTKIILHGLDEYQMDKPVVFEENGNIMVADKDRMLIYDIKKQSFSKTVYVWNGKSFKVTGTCVESLVSPKFSINNKN